MMTKELRAAAERMRGVEGPTFHGVGGKRSISEREYCDAITLALAWLADHPADEDEPITAEWLASVGFVVGKFPRDLIRGPVLRGVSSAGDEYWTIRTYPIPNDAKPRTRGHLRRLCAALGVPLTEAA